MLRRHFRPEFLNRLDGVVSFKSLQREDMMGILDIQLSRIENRLARREIRLDGLARGQAPAGRPRLRPDLRRAPAQAPAAERPARPAGHPGSSATRSAPGQTVVATPGKTPRASDHRPSKIR